MRWILFFLLSYSTTLIFAQAQSQKDWLIRLNRHYFEIPPEDTINHVYNKFVSTSGDTATLARIFTLDGEVNRVVLTKAPKGEYYEQVTDQYGDYTQLKWRKIQNLYNAKFLTQYFFNDKVVGQVLSDSPELFQVARNGESEPIQQAMNDFEPHVSVPLEDFFEFVGSKFRVSTKLYPDHLERFWIAILVNEHGMVEQIEWANPLGGNPKIAAEYIRVIKLWGNNFSPALDSFGKPVSKWMLISF